MQKYIFLLSSSHATLWAACWSWNTQVQILTIAKLAAPSSTILKSSFENATCQKRSWMKFERFARTLCRNVGTFSANLCKLFPNLRIRHSKVGQETWKLGGHAWTVLTVTHFVMPFSLANCQNCYKTMKYCHYINQIKHFMDQNLSWLIINRTQFQFWKSRILFSCYVPLDDYAKDGGPGASDLNVVFTMILCATNFLFGKLWSSYS